MYRATRMDKVLQRIAVAYGENPSDFDDPELWSEVEDALNFPDGSLGRRTLQDMADSVWREENKDASKEREEKNR